MTAETRTSSPASARSAPGPRGHPLLGNTLGFKNDILNTLAEGWRSHGDLVQFRGVGPLFPVYLFVHPDHVMHALKDRHDIYPKTPLINDKWRMVVGDGLICSTGEFWKRQRRIAQPSFDPKKLMSFDGLIVQETTELLDDWDAKASRGETLEMSREMTHLALASLGGAMFTTDWRREAKLMAPAVEAAIGHAYHQIESMVAPPEWAPTPANRRFRESRNVLHGIMERIIESRRTLRDDEQPPDLLGGLMTTADPETGEKMSDVQVRNELMTFMFGGHETVASGMAWTLYLLSKHPEVRRRARAEVDETLGGRVPTKDDIWNLKYLGCVINESLRLYPPVSLISRTPIQDDVVGGYRVPAGSMCLISSYISHRHPDFWDNPEGFDPDRWLPERSEGRRKDAWFPFSGGPRQCIGGYFGLIEMHIVMSMVLQRFEVDLFPGHPVKPRPGITLGFEHGLRMNVRQRDLDPEQEAPAKPVAAVAPE
jgi:cytochrome P450